MADLSIKLKTLIDSAGLDASIKSYAKNASPLKLRVAADISDLASTSTAFGEKLATQLARAGGAADAFQTKLNNLKTTGGLTQSQFDGFNAELQTLRSKLAQSVPDIDDFSEGMRKLKNRVSEASTSTKSMGQSITEIIGKFAKWYFIAGLVTGVTNALKQMVAQVIELDTAMVELNKVYDATDEQLKKVKDSAFELASQLGTTGLDVINATTEFKRMGYTIDESLDLAKTAIMLTNVAEGLDDAGEAASILASILKGLGVGAEYSESVLDRLNEISNNNAVSLTTLADMAQRAAATMNILGNTFDQTLGLLTGSYEVLQDERVAKGIQTIGLRIAGLNEDLSAQIGLSNQVTKGLQKYAGINAFDEQTGQIKSTYAILEELSDKWDQLNTNQRVTLQNLLGGKERADVVASLMANWEGVTSAIEDAENSSGSAREEQEAFLKSIVAGINEVKNAFMDVARELIPSELIKSFVGLIKSALVLLKPVATLIGNIIRMFQFDKQLDQFSALFEYIGDFLTKYLNYFTPALDLMEEFFELAYSLAEWARPVLEWTLDIFGKITDAFNSLMKPVKSVVDWISNAGKDITNFFKRLAGATDDAKDSSKDLADTYNQEEVNNYTKALGDLTNAIGDQKIAAQEYLETLQKQNEERQKEKELNEKILAVEKARRAYEEAKSKRIRVFRAGIGYDWESDAQEVQTAQESLNEAIDALSEYKYDLALSRAQEFVTEFQEILSGDNVIEGWEELFNNFSDLLDTEFADYLEKSQEFVDKFNEEWGELGARAKEAEEKKNETSNNDVSAGVRAATMGSKWNGNDGRAWASGTTNAPAGLSLVGEEGPELRVLNQGDGIIPADLTRNLMSLARNPKIIPSAASGQTLVFNGALNFPNVKNADDAKGFIEGIMTIGASKIPKYN